MATERSSSDRFPRSAGYNPEWLIAAVSGAANPLWLTEWLSSALELKPGMRVLDLGCGRAASSIFLRREFGVQAWATDLWFSASENLKRIRDADVEDGVFPIHSDARSLPFAQDFFDAVVSIESFYYYGTDDLYLQYLARFVKPGGVIAIAGTGLMQDIDGAIPSHLRDWWAPDMACLRSAAWWRQHWQRSGVADVVLADSMEDGWKLWLDWHHIIAPGNQVEIDAITADQGRYIGYIRAVCRRKADVELPAIVQSLESQYVSKPLLRS